MDHSKKIVSTDPYKGVRDFYPEDMAVEKYIFSVMKQTVESFGYVEYTASPLEPSELYKSKTSEEIVNEQTYTFKDRGDREVTLRPEMTPTVARMVAAKKRELSFPLRWYSIPNVFRYERPQRGRLREHYQLNVDLFGLPNIEGDLEIVTLAHKIMISFGIDQSKFEIRISDREAFDQALEGKGFDPEQKAEARRLLDKKNKIKNFEEVWQEMIGEPFEALTFSTIRLEEFKKQLERRGVKNVTIDPYVVRGFDYYTGIVFEVFDKDPSNNRSLFGGGRYDNLMEIFGEEKIPTVGFGMGDVTIRDTLETYGLIPPYQPTAKLALCLMGEEFKETAEKLADLLREEGVNTVIDYSFKKIGDQIKKADREKIPFVICIGEDELKQKIYTLKELISGKETSLSAEEIAKTIKTRNRN